ncbi:histidine phosphatase family protein [Cellulomonas sp. NPDC089187]|uniref:histidine phosphatase family protein n=1 Tax=Cellulomonas sp. NPDC089187 TaxID=3154970 RepID=UPI0034471A37
MTRFTATPRRFVAGVTAALLLGLTAGCASEQAEAGDGATTASGAGEVTVYFTRHGQTWLNTVDRVQGWSDSPLTETGREQAELLGAGLAEAGVDIDAAYSADMLRHFETASIVLDAMGEDALVPTRDEGLREIAFGEWEGAKNQEMWSQIATILGYADYDALVADMANLDMREIFDTVAPQFQVEGVEYEGGTEAGERALDALTEIAEDQAEAGGGDVLVVSSGLTITMALIALGADPAELSGGIHNGSVSELSYSGGEWSIVSMNDGSYAGHDE